MTEKISNTSGIPSEEHTRRLKTMQAVYDNLPESIFLTDETGNIVDCNRQALSHYGYSQVELRNLSLIDILADTVADNLPDVLKKESTTGGITLQTHHKTKNGDSFPVCMRTKLIDIEDRRYRLVTVFLNANETPQSKADKVREEITDAFNDILPQVSSEPALLFEMDERGRLISANSFFFEKTGYTSYDIRNGLSVDSILTSAESPKGMSVLDHIITCENNNFPDFTLICRDSSVLPVMGSFYDSMLTGNKRGVKACLYDISEQKHFEHNLRMMEKLNALGETAGGVVHDFNNIISIILGNLDILEKQVDTSQVKSIANTIRRVALDGRDIVQRLQNFSQLYIQHIEEPVDVNEVIIEAVSLLRPKWQATQRSQGISISIDTELGEVMPVLTTSSELREVVINILLNAFDAMPSGGTITIRTALLDTFVMITIADTGIGMSRVTKQRLFEPFYTTKKKKGTGLGLSISYGIIKKYGGDITIDSEEGSGATFTITLPALKEEKARDRSADVPADASLTGDILVIDDEKAICDLLKEFLESEGLRVTVATGGRTALELLKQQAFPIVLTDLNMPEVSGWEIARYVRKHHPDSAIIMLSGWEDRVKHINKQEQIIDYILQKPVPFPTLSEIIRTLKQKK